MSQKTPDTPPEHTSLKQLLLVPGLLFVGLIILALVVGIIRSDDTQASQTSTGSQAGKLLSDATMTKFRNKWDEYGVAVGSPDAPVIVREFADYQCPACRAFESTADRIREQYVESGKVRFVFFDFPLRMHTNSRDAAAAARCAGRQDAYWPFHSRLYSNQREWASMTDPMSAFLNYAVESGIKAQRLRQCLVQDATNQIIAKNVEIARKIGVRATPTVLVGSRVFSGGTTFSKLSQAIEKQLAQSGKQ